jgi:hypothetical protein
MTNKFNNKESYLIGHRLINVESLYLNAKTTSFKIDILMEDNIYKYVPPVVKDKAPKNGLDILMEDNKFLTPVVKDKVPKKRLDILTEKNNNIYLSKTEYEYVPIYKDFISFISYTHLKYLNITNHNITKIELPNTLETLFIQGNKLTEFIAPESLIYLNISKNELTKIIFNKILITVNASNNNIEVLYDLPITLKTIYIINNPIYNKFESIIKKQNDYNKMNNETNQKEIIDEINNYYNKYNRLY